MAAPFTAPPGVNAERAPALRNDSIVPFGNAVQLSIHHGYTIAKHTQPADT